jgi:DNA-binding transcriptional MerR regulator
MTEALTLSDVVKRTGLTARALRCYEARGLVRPLRTESGRRLYGPAELARLTQITILKAAGFSLANIAKLLDGELLDFPRLIVTQIEMLARERDRISQAMAVLSAARARTDRGEPLDAATLCSLIESGDRTMRFYENWRDVTSEFLSPEERQAAADAARKLPPNHFEVQRQKWRDLGARIEAALPLDPDSALAESFVREWLALIAPWWQVASPAARAAAKELYGRMGEWEGRAEPGFSLQAVKAVQAAGARMRADGKLAWPPASPESE